MIREFFGEQWDVPALQDAIQIPTPVGFACIHCDEPIEDGDQGVMTIWVSRVGPPAHLPVHRECDLRMILGGINHLEGRCSCHGGTLPPDPPDVTRRHAALLVLAWTLDHGGVP